MEALYVVLVGFCLVLLSSCAHDPKLDKKIQAESQGLPVLNATARAEAAEMVFQGAALTDEQRARLEEITLSANTEMQALRDRSAKLRLLLVRQLVNPDASDREVEAIKDRILDADRENAKRWVAALDEARQVLGRRNPEDAPFYRALMEETPGTEKPDGRPGTK